MAVLLMLLVSFCAERPRRLFALAEASGPSGRPRGRVAPTAVDVDAAAAAVVLLWVVLLDVLEERAMLSSVRYPFCVKGLLAFFLCACVVDACKMMMMRVLCAVG